MRPLGAAALLLAACTPIAPDGDAGRDAGRADAGRADTGPSDAGACAVDCHPAATCLGDRCAPPRFTQIAAGDRATCALVDQDEVWCWGRNDSGALGQGDDVPYEGAVRVEGLPTPIHHLEGGYGATCVIAGAESELWCWGNNRGGRFLDDGTYLRPQAILTTPVAHVAIGEAHLCAVVDEGATVRCRGANNVGQLGRPPPSMGSTSFLGWGPVAGLPGEVSAIAATWIGDQATCVIVRADRDVWCWGNNAHLLVGLDDGTPFSATPVQIAGASGCSDLALGNQSGCAVCDGEVRCWGTEEEGQLGGGGDTAVATPVPFVSSPPIDPGELTVNTWATLVVDRTDGSVWGWGDSDLGVLGLPAGMIVEPARLHSSETAIALTGSASHTCALVDRMGERAILCSGSNDHGQLGSASAGRLTAFTEATVFSAP